MFTVHSLSSCCSQSVNSEQARAHFFQPDGSPVRAPEAGARGANRAPRQRASPHGGNRDGFRERPKGANSTGPKGDAEPLLCPAVSRAGGFSSIKPAPSCRPRQKPISIPATRSARACTQPGPGCPVLGAVPSCRWFSFFPRSFVAAGLRGKREAPPLALRPCGCCWACRFPMPVNETNGGRERHEPDNRKNRGRTDDALYGGVARDQLLAGPAKRGERGARYPARPSPGPLSAGWTGAGPAPAPAAAIIRISPQTVVQRPPGAGQGENSSITERFHGP
jgi:hypothetical protein